MDYCHAKGVAHRDLKLENALIDNGGEQQNGGGGGAKAPRLKICDFGYSKHSLIDSAPKSAVGTPAYIAPEVLKRQGQYDGRAADVWSCGVTLYVMLCGRYPFEDKNDPKNFRKTVKRILNGEYGFPSKVALSEKCRELLAGIFQVDVAKRLTMEDIKNDEWFNVNLPSELFDENVINARAQGFEPVERAALERIVEKARETPHNSKATNLAAAKEEKTTKRMNTTTTPADENRRPMGDERRVNNTQSRTTSFRAMSVDEYMDGDYC